MRINPIRITLVVATAANGVIGKDGGLPWDLPSDLKRFKEMTLGKPILMGRKTWESLPRRPLPGRDNLVVSRQVISRQPSAAGEGAEMEGALWFSGPDPAIAWAEQAGREELCVIGGADLFAAVLPRATHLRLTLIDQEIDGNTRLPPLGEGWTDRWVSAPQSENGLTFRYIDRARG